MGSEQDFSESVIRHQLENILQSRAFKNSNILSGFLKFVVDETLAGRSGEIKEYSIGIKVLFRRSDFNPQLDSIVRMHAGRLRRALNEYYNDAGRNDLVRIEIPKGAYFPLFLSHKNTVNSEPVERVTPLRNKPVVAIFPFRNISKNSSYDFFADGFGEQMSTDLTQFQDLVVISYYSSRHVVGKTTDVKEAAKLLGAQYIVTGSMQFENKQMLIRVQLNLGETGEQLWAKHFERKNTGADLFEIQYEIVRNILKAIGGYWGVIFRDILHSFHYNRVDDKRVYDAVFWYYYFQNNSSPEGYLKAISALEAAVEADPNYALAWAMLSELYMNDHAHVFRKIDSSATKALECALRAVSIDPKCQHAYQALAWAYLCHHQRDECLKAVGDCISINPNAGDKVGGMGFVMICIGEFEQGYELLNDSILNNPYCPWWFNGAFVFYFLYKKDYRKALDFALKVDVAGSVWDPLLKAAVFGNLGQTEEAGKMVNKLTLLLPDAGSELKNIFSFLLSEDLKNELITGLRIAGLTNNQKKIMNNL